MIDPADEAAVTAQLGRRPRSTRAIAARCPCSLPAVVATPPRLEDGTPFPTTFYLTCPRAASRIGTLEAEGLMREMADRLAADPELAAAYAEAHVAYLAARAELGAVDGDAPEIAGISAGGMPDRVKCLHVLAAQSLAQGRGVNPLGDEVLDRLGAWWTAGPCVEPPPRHDRVMTLVGAVDCGTNTIWLLIGDLPDVQLRESRIVRLGEGVDATARLAPGALARTFAAVEEYADLLARAGVPPERLRFCATSATRDADNAEEFATGVETRIGVRPEVLTGAEEAGLTFAGAVRDLRTTERPVLVLDVGGGSTELVLGDVVPEQACSLDVGSVRLTERRLHGDPPTAGEVAACVADIDAALDGAPVDLAAARTVVGVAGTVLTLGALVLDLPAYDGSRVDGTALAAADVAAVVERLVTLSVADRLALPSVRPGRADVIAAGGLIVDRVLRRCSVDTLVASRADLLDGIAWSLLG